MCCTRWIGVLKSTTLSFPTCRFIFLSKREGGFITLARPLPPPLEKNCGHCKKEFKTYRKDQIFCSNDCKLKVLNTPKNKPMIRCFICSDLFTPRNKGSKYCNSEKISNCITCLKDFTHICESQSSTRFCGKICTAAHNRKDRKAVKCLCSQCGAEFTSNHKARNDCGNHKGKCLACGSDFKTKYNPSKVQNYCSIYCNNLRNSKTLVTPDLIMEYKDPEMWSKKFFTENRRKPTSKDFQVHFGISKTPDRAMKFLSKKRGSLEDPVLNYIIEISDDVVRNTRPLRYEGKRLEIDLLIPSLKLGFEVQDFKTHSHQEKQRLGIKENDTRFKNGPAYHELKRKLAKDQLGVTLIDIWEDSIKDGSYKSIVMNAIAESKRLLLIK